MCGIATISIGRGHRGRIPYPLLRSLVKQMTVELSARGEDASGIAVVNQDACYVYKKPLRPSRLVVRPRYQEILEQIGPQTNFIMVHTRAASVSDNSNNIDNHPILAEPIVGVHNGTLMNADRLFKKYRKDIEKRQGKVDSEVIFRLLHMYIERGLPMKEAMCEVSNELIGAFTGAAVDVRNPNTLLVFRYQRSLCMLTLPHYDIIINVSEPRFYDVARKKLKMNPKDECRYLKEGTGAIVDLNLGKITEKVEYFTMPVRNDAADVSTYWNNWVRFAG